MSNTPQSSESSNSQETLNAETDGVCGEERLAAILLRLLGVYFLALGIISGIEEAVRLCLAFNEIQVDLGRVLLKHWSYLAHLAAEFVIGAYLLIGGQWVFEKVLIPIIPGRLKDEHAVIDKEEVENQIGADQSSETKTI
jgi:hypothetical protein